MVNLLFISSNSKVEIIKITLQPLLKVKIDIVGDFDYGLKDVFEKRPALVFIQDQIAGVTGESVARHIQMLLGSGAPAFIFMHEGNLKAKPVKGLYEYLIDLSQDDTKVLADTQSTLASILGPQWQKVFVPPNSGRSDVMNRMELPEKPRVNADQLVDDCISNLGGISPKPATTSFPLSDIAMPDVSSDEPFTFISSPHDQLAEIVSEASKERKGKGPATNTARNVKTEKTFSLPDPTAAFVQGMQSATSSESAKPDVRMAAVFLEGHSAVPVEISAPSIHTAQAVEEPSASTDPGMFKRLKSPLVSPADFRIERERITENAAQKGSLRAFEANLLTKTSARKRYRGITVVLMLCLLGGGWLLLKQNQSLLLSGAKTSLPDIVPAQTVTPVSVAQQSLSAAQRAVVTVLPSFIPLEGHDSAFAAQKPGWERYVGADSEYRVFRSNGKLKALQVLATNGYVISESRLRSQLTELTGTGAYRITSQEQKHGFQISHASVKPKADLLIYRKKSAVRAFVVSLE